MKAKVVVGSLLATMIAFGAVAQRVENDDMYFKAKDREKLKAEKADVSVNDKIDADYNAFRKKHFDKNEAETETASEATNPTDSYSSRNINPEYISRSNAEQASEEENYYMEGYVPENTYDSYSAGGYNNNWNYNNSFYGNYGYGSPYNSFSNPYSMYNPYYGGYYGGYSPWMSPYYGSGLTFSLGYMWGNPGWNYGMGYGWGNPYSIYPSYYSPYYGYGYGYPTNYYIDTEPVRGNYGKRPSRHSAIVSPTPRSTQRVTSTTNSTQGSNGRTRQTVDEYYVKPYKRATPVDRYTNSMTESSYGSSGRSTMDYPASRTRSSVNTTRETRSSTSSFPTFSTPSRSSSEFSMPSRSSSSGSSSGGSSSPAPRKRD